MKIIELIENVDDIIKEMFNKNCNVYIKMKDILVTITETYNEFIKIVPDLNNIGMEIDMEIILGQLRNMSEAIEKRDKVQLFDTLKYEVWSTLDLYREIRTIMEQE